MSTFFRRVSRVLLLIGFLLPLASVAQAQDDILRFTDPGWQASYWNNRTLSGTPTLQRFDQQLNFDWAYGSPDPAIASDNFSVRWERFIDLTPGNYRFTAVSDDGIRVWLDSELIIDGWSEHAAQRFTAERSLKQGTHAVRVEYFEAGGAASAEVSWALIDAQPPTIRAWRGEYYNNTTLSGTPITVRDDADINFQWNYSAPAVNISPDNFSVRWTRNLDLPAGRYRFTMTVDDGARLFINGRTLIDAWRDQAVTPYTGEIDLSGGSTTIAMEYYERGGSATAQLRWDRLDAPTPTATPYPTPTPTPSGAPITEWRAEYFNNRTLSGQPIVTRNDRAIDFDWGNASPIPGRINPDEFSVRWLQTLNLTPGTYRFTTTVDDGVRLYLNGRLFIESWKEQAPTTLRDTIYLNGPVAVEMQYFEAFGGATARLNWERVTGGDPSPTPYPTATATPRPYPTSTPGARGSVIVDNTDSSFVKGGSPSGWQSVPEGYGGSLLWSRNNDRVRPYYNWGRWYPQLQPGYYEVYVYIPFRYTTTANARYWVSHADGYTQRSVSQSANGDRWISLGSYRFQGNDNDYVSLADVTFEPRLSRLIAWDAVKWEPR